MIKTILLSFLLIAITNSSSFHLEGINLPERRGEGNNLEVETSGNSGNFNIKASIKSVQCIEEILNIYYGELTEERILWLYLNLDFNKYHVSHSQLVRLGTGFLQIYRLNIKNASIDKNGAKYLLHFFKGSVIKLENVMGSIETYKILLQLLKLNLNPTLILDEH